MRVAELMTPKVRSISADATVADAVREMADGHVSALPVLQGQAVVGVVSTTDLLQAQAEVEDRGARAVLFEQTAVADLMTRDPLTIEPDADVRDAARQMLYADVHRLFVVNDGRLVGVLSQTDIAQAVGNGRV
ncbi:MAG: CBS domain-containing protein [Gemmatimonadota bacterium]|jgi:CBS domain-containing protein|nr:CBS domain-containing protein [Gemmatimonadota bacterium]